MPKEFIKNSQYLLYNPSLKERAGEMRNNSTKGEIKFWCELLRHRMTGYQFYRQRPIGKYIVDFYCSRLQTVVEIDGTSHIGKEEYDLRREKDLMSHGLKILHYDDLMVLNNFQIIENDFKEQLKIREEELGFK
jgi:very-short-patch-repair endonuclease